VIFDVSFPAGREFIVRDGNMQGHANRPRGEPCIFPSPAFCWSHVDLQRDVITGNFDMESQ
ncbi:hypothetical protein KSZ10_15780, partial [Alistipes shahii]|nr:hypothetical protein [Alistipes shahii]